MVTDKGGMVLQMPRYVEGRAGILEDHAQFCHPRRRQSATVDDFEKVAEQAPSGQGKQLTWFFRQWLDSTGAPEFKNKYTVFRVPNGFRVVGEVPQDLDLFRMPVHLRSILMARPKIRPSTSSGLIPPTRLKPSVNLGASPLIRRTAS